jgi:hypothetical protein
MHIHYVHMCACGIRSALSRLPNNTQVAADTLDGVYLVGGNECKVEQQHMCHVQEQHQVQVLRGQCSAVLQLLLQNY